MPFDVDNPLINGFRPDYSRITFALGDRQFQPGITEISYKDNIDRGQARANQQQILAYTPGEYKAEASITILLDEADDMIEQLGGHGFMERPFNIVVVYRKVALGKKKRDTIVGCLFKENDNSHKQGNEALVIKRSLDVSYILHNGFNPLVNMRR